MTLLTDDGREWYGAKGIDAVATRLDTVAIGTGTDSEQPGASTLADEVYRSTVPTENVEFTEGDDVGVVEAAIEVKGGTEVPAGTEVSELAVIADGDGGGETVVWIDEFDGVTVNVGIGERFSMDFQHTR